MPECEYFHAGKVVLIGNITGNVKPKIIRFFAVDIFTDCLKIIRAVIQVVRII